jgi:retron-type reverse transcriptase
LISGHVTSGGSIPLNGLEPAVGLPQLFGIRAISSGATAPPLPGTSISTTVIATTIMWTTTTTYVRFVPENHHSLFKFPQVYRAYLDCRRSKRNSLSALAYEVNHEEDLLRLTKELRDGRYRPQASICFYTEKPKCREIFAADFRDRIVHHLVYSFISPVWENIFVYHSYACRSNKGTHAAAKTLQKFLRSATNNGSRRAYYLKMDIHNFFMSIDRQRLYEMLAAKCRNPDMRELLRIIVFHDPTTDYIMQDRENLRQGLPKHKSLFYTRPGCGLPIGNLTSQFFANVYLNALDQFIKHTLKALYYLRYVDDFILVSRYRRELEQWREEITRFSEERLALTINPRAIRLAPVSGGVDFAGFIIRPHYKLVRRRVVGNLKEKLRRFEDQLVERQGDLVIYHFDTELLRQCQAVFNSYLGHFSHAQTGKLIFKTWEQFPFLSRYFRLTGNKVIPHTRPLGKLTLLKQQIRWLQKNYKNHYCLLQIGYYYEIFGGHAISLANMMGFQLLENWRGFRYACGFPKWCLPNVEAELQRRGIRYVVVEQSGRELYKTRERLSSRLVEYFMTGKEHKEC